MVKRSTGIASRVVVSSVRGQTAETEKDDFAGGGVEFVHERREASIQSCSPLSRLSSIHTLKLNFATLHRG